MIIPVRIDVERREAPESYSDGTFLFGADNPQEPIYVVKAQAIDTDKKIFREYRFHSMADKLQEDWSSVGVVSHTSIEAHVGYLRKLRDQLNEILGDEDA
jgi:hypothetical protein